MANLVFYYGAMNSGKTTGLLQDAYNLEERNLKVAVLKPEIDTKGERKIVSRLGISREVDHLLKKTEHPLQLVKENYLECNRLYVDEAQFLEPFQVEEFSDIAHRLQIQVYCYGLRTDFLTHGFPGSIRLLELADRLEELETICPCGEKARFVARFINHKMQTEGNQVLIDQKEGVSYLSLCAKCYQNAKEDDPKTLKLIQKSLYPTQK